MANTLGHRIRFLRDERNLSQKEMARQLNISNVQLNRYESGARKPDPDMIVQIADYLHVSTDYLLGRTSSIQETPSAYVGKKESEMMERIRKTPVLASFIDELSSHPEDAEKLMKIWAILREKRS